MENATKALLIAAAVLIAIVLITLGVNLLNAGSDTAKQAGQVGEELDKGIGSSADEIAGGLASLEGLKIINKENAEDFVTWVGIDSANYDAYVQWVKTKECRCIIFKNSDECKNFIDSINKIPLEQMLEKSSTKYPNDLSVSYGDRFIYDKNGRRILFICVVEEQQ